MKNVRIFLAILTSACLVAVAGCGVQGGGGMEGPESGRSTVIQVEDTVGRDKEAEPVDDTQAKETPVSQAEFLLDLEKGTLSAKLTYGNDPRVGTSFFLNRDFVVTALACDGKEVDADVGKELVEVDDGYTVNRYPLPPFKESLTIHYTGMLTGQTGISPYVRETISPEFSMLRWETFCYPQFADDWDSLLAFFLNQDEPLEAQVTVCVPDGYAVAAPFPLLGLESGGGAVSYTFDGDLFHLDLAIARYDVAELPTGEYYFLPGTDLEEMEALINPVMSKAHRFMSDTFGEAELSTAMRYIVIPEGYGSYALTGKAVFVESGAFQSTEDMLQLVHEYVHLGWNPVVEDQVVQRCRFFDEGFTCYFTARAAGYLLGEEAYRAEIDRCKQRLKSAFERDNSVMVPLVEYGRNESGGLSYYMGPVLFDEMAALVGEDVLDQATKAFLARYRDTPVDFETMARAYEELCGRPELEDFFRQWFYSTEGIQRVLGLQ